MKRLGKFLAVVTLVVVSAALGKAFIFPTIVSKAADGDIGQISVIGPSCGPSDPNNPVSAAELPDINVKLRGFELVPDSEHDVVDYTGKFSLDIDPKSPNLNDMFEDGYAPIAASFRVGTWEGDGLETDPWLNATAFQTTTGEEIFVPDSGYDIGDGYEVMVLYADSNSITIKYTREDNIISGYAIHVLGIKVNPDILKQYKDLDKAGRKQLPALKAGTLLGTALGPAILVEYRDTGAFLDPRSCVDHWDSCKKHPLQQPTISEAAVNTYLNLPELGLNKRSAPRAERQPQCDVTYLSKYPKYPPLGSLESCPTEFKTVGSVSDEQITVPGSIDSYYCGVQPIPEPQQCTKPELADEEFCDGDKAWCYPTSCDAMENSCRTGRKGCAKFIQFCDDLNVGNGEVYWLKRLDKAHASEQGCSLLNEEDRNTIGRCMAYKGVGKSKPVTITAKKTLPSCVPTTSTNNRCTSACGTPLKIDESLAFSVSGDCATGQCKASIKLKDDSALMLPFAAQLANYFTGTFDAGAVADGYISKEDLLRIRSEVKAGNTESINEMFARAGVARKILPEQIQDSLKCQFVKDIKAKIEAFGAAGGDLSKIQNTKYLYKDKDGSMTEFKIGDVPISQIEPPPFLDESCRPIGRDEDKVLAWSKTGSGQAWVDVPLFDNEDSQGKIEFVSGGVFTPELNPIQTSIPEIKRLYSATQIIQNALVPQVYVRQNENLVAYRPTPDILGLTIGPEIDPGGNLLACKKSTPTLKDIYGNQKGYKLEPETEAYTLGVDCIQQNTQEGKDGSKVCTVGPEGQLNCFQQQNANQNAITKNFPNVTVQVRNVTPYLYDTFLQTIEDSRGLLRIFKPEAVKQGKEDEFGEAFKGYPAKSNAVQYQMDFGQGVKLSEGQSNWNLLFDKLGGVQTATQFVLKLLYPSTLKPSEN